MKHDNTKFQKISRLFPWRALRNFEGGGRESQNQKLSMGKYGYFLELHTYQKYIKYCCRCWIYLQLMSLSD